MHISKQAIEAGAKAIAKTYSGHEQDYAGWIGHSSACLTEALKHIIPKECDDDLFNRCCYVFDKTRGTFNDGMRAAINHAFTLLRGEGKQANIGDDLVSALTQGVADLKNGVPLKATEYANGERKTGTFANGKFTPTVKECLTTEPDDEQVERVARAIHDETGGRLAWEENRNQMHWFGLARAAISAMQCGETFNKGRNDALRIVGEWLGITMPTFRSVRNRIDELKSSAMQGTMYGVWRICPEHFVTILNGVPVRPSIDKAYMETLAEFANKEFDGDYEVRPYVEQVEETAEEIANRILTPPMFYSESFCVEAQQRVAAAITAERAKATKGVQS